MRPTERPMVEHNDLLTQRANHFDPNAYRLLVKVGCKKDDVAKLVSELDEPTNAIEQKSQSLIKYG